MNEPDTTVENETMSESRGPGELLQASRKEMGLSIEDVATRMHLSRDIVDAIETNNFSDITAPIFVKGYLRAYAKIVSLDENEMIQQYVEFYSNEDPPISSTSNLVPEISASDRRVKIFTFLVIVGLVALLAIWWWSKYQTQTDVVSLDAQQTNDIQAAETVQESAMIEIEVDSETSKEATVSVEASVIAEDVQKPLLVAAEASVGTTASMQSEPEPQPEPKDIASEVPDEAAGLVSAEQLQTGNEVVQPQQSAISAPTVLSDQITREAPTGADQLRIVVNADSWMEINDASGHRLLYRLVRAYQKFNLTGMAPFTVFIGNGYGVEITLNGEEVDVIGRVRSDNTVRLKIGG